MSNEERIKDFFQKRRNFYNQVISTRETMIEKFKSSNNPFEGIAEIIASETKEIFIELNFLNNLIEQLAIANSSIMEWSSSVMNTINSLPTTVSQSKEVKELKEKLDILEANLIKREKIFKKIERWTEKRSSEMERQRKDTEEKVKQYIG